MTLFAETHGPHGVPKGDGAASEQEPASRPDATTMKSEVRVLIDRANGKHIEIRYERDTKQIIFHYREAAPYTRMGRVSTTHVQFGISLDEWGEIQHMLGVDG